MSSLDQLKALAENPQGFILAPDDAGSPILEAPVAAAAPTVVHRIVIAPPAPAPAGPGAWLAASAFGALCAAAAFVLVSAALS